jgi:hypothetical protein
VTESTFNSRRGEVEDKGGEYTSRNLKRWAGELGGGEER